MASTVGGSAAKGRAARPLVVALCGSLVASILFIASPAAGTVGEITEYGTPGGWPNGITAGPDGNVWFTEIYGNSIGRITPSGEVIDFPVPSASSLPFGIAAGPDGNLWFTESQRDLPGKIGRITTSGVVTEFPIPTAGGAALGITAGPDGNLWFAENSGNKIGRITLSGTVTEFDVPTADSFPYDITAGPDGNLWFTESSGNRIGRMTTSGTITEFGVPTDNSQPHGIASGPDGNVWFAEWGGSKIGQIDPSGTIAEFPVSGGTEDVATGPDGNVWITEYYPNLIGRVTPSGSVTEYPIPTSNAGAEQVAAGANGTLWFTEQANKVGQVELRPTPDLTLSPSKTKVKYKQSVTLTVHLSAHGSNDVVSVYETPYGSPSFLAGRGSVDPATGNYTLSVTLYKKTAFEARFDGDEAYTPTVSSSITVSVYPIIGGSLSGYYGRSGIYRLYHFTWDCPRSNRGCPTYSVSVAPNHRRQWIYFTLQLYLSGAWRTVLSFRARLNAKSKVTVLFVYQGRDVIGIPTRARGLFNGDADHLKVHTGWSYFKVTR